MFVWLMFLAGVPTVTAGSGNRGYKLSVSYMSLYWIILCNICTLAVLHSCKSISACKYQIAITN